MSFNKACQALIVEAGGVEALIFAMRADRAEKRVQTACCLALGYLADTVGYLERILHDGGAKNVVATLLWVTEIHGFVQ